MYVATFFAARASSMRDPTSIFFKPDIGYEPKYFTQRKQQADNYIANVESVGTFSLPKFNPHRRNESICVGIPTIARNDVYYFPSMIGSMLQGLRPIERERIFLMPFIAHSDPQKHPAYSESWLSGLSDKVLMYNLSMTEMDRIVWLEKNTGYREKGLFDYTYLLKACVDVGSPYIAMLEDDVVAMDGWFHRTKNALSELEKDPKFEQSE
jgi:hypothetical protein